MVSFWFWQLVFKSLLIYSQCDLKLVPKFSRSQYPQSENWTIALYISKKLNVVIINFQFILYHQWHNFQIMHVSLFYHVCHLVLSQFLHCHIQLLEISLCFSFSLRSVFYYPISLLSALSSPLPAQPVLRYHNSPHASILESLELILHSGMRA
jgi:hypothetical protein